MGDPIQGRPVPGVLEQDSHQQPEFPDNDSFPRAVRLTQSAQFDAVFKYRKLTFRRAPLRLLCKPNRMPSARIGLVIAKRMVAKAHDRNRIKRTIRDMFRRERRSLPQWDLVVQLTGPCTATQVRTALAQLFQEIRRHDASKTA